MKKVIIAIILTICALGLYFIITNKKFDPDAKKVQEMTMVKYSNVVVYEGRYIEKDKNRINTILTALKDRSKEHNVIRYNCQNYSIYMMLLNPDKRGAREYRYDIFIDKDGIYVTMPFFSNQSYKLGAEGEKVIRDFIDNNNFTIE